MTGKQNIIQAFEYQPTQDWVPFWELEFHLWNAFQVVDSIPDTCAIEIEYLAS